MLGSTLYCGACCAGTFLSFIFRRVQGTFLLALLIRLCTSHTGCPSLPSWVAQSSLLQRLSFVCLHYFLSITCISLHFFLFGSLPFPPPLLIVLCTASRHLLCSSLLPSHPSLFLRILLFPRIPLYSHTENHSSPSLTLVLVHGTLMTYNLSESFTLMPFISIQICSHKKNDVVLSNLNECQNV